jgi:nitrite reductase/ring-hydroxylating ferredoxin subunit
MPWHKALAIESLPLGAHTRVELQGQAILLSHLDDGFFAVHDVCLHRGASLAAGPLENGLITCHLHFWAFDARNGACAQVPGLALRAFNTKTEEGDLYVEI